MAMLTRDAGDTDLAERDIKFETDIDEADLMLPQDCYVGGGYASIYPTYVTICH
ncbi:hypothetical protein [Rudaeicoccus suwonensis]|uniref:hypothetical protein n=1 Tax=Rudaeicoccus suwonensis TaxID=657409 RepID=UPI0014775F7B|nr:hypothetical protein [Rudaeicoccus suwonensis]